MLNSKEEKGGRIRQIGYCEFARTNKAVDGSRVQLPSDIITYVEGNNYGSRINKLYDSRILELEAIENLGATDAAGDGQVQQSVHVTPRSSISVEELFNMVVGPARKYIPSSTDNIILSNGSGKINTDFSENEIGTLDGKTFVHEASMREAADLFERGVHFFEYERRAAQIRMYPNICAAYMKSEIRRTC